MSPFTWISSQDMTNAAITQCTAYMPKCMYPIHSIIIPLNLLEIWGEERLGLKVGGREIHSNAPYCYWIWWNVLCLLWRKTKDKKIQLVTVLNWTIYIRPQQTGQKWYTSTVRNDHNLLASENHRVCCHISRCPRRRFTGRVVPNEFTKTAR